MADNKNNFRHESLQDAESIAGLLKAIIKGLDKGKLNFSDSDGEIQLQPKGLLNVKLKASKEEGRNRFTMSVSWQEEPKAPKGKKSLAVNKKK